MQSKQVSLTHQCYVRDEREPNAEGMTAIAKAGVNLNWSVSCEGEMFQTVKQRNYVLEQEEQLLAGYCTMPENLQNSFSISFQEINKLNKVN
nr:XRE family transcriptional regulator [Glaesserella parasuis]